MNIHFYLHAFGGLRTDWDNDTFDAGFVLFTTLLANSYLYKNRYVLQGHLRINYENSKTIPSDT